MIPVGAIKRDRTRAYKNYYGLVSKWSFNKSDATDDIGSNDGTVHDAILTEGKIGKAYDFNGINNYINVPYNSSLDFKGAGKSFTITVHGIRMDSLAVDGGIAGRWFANGGYQYILKFESTDSCAKFAIHDGATQLITSAVNSISLNTWAHVVAVADSGTMKLYINGESSGTTDTYSTITDIGADIGLEIGVAVRGDTSEWLSGIIDEVMIFNRALSSNEVKALNDLGC